MGIPIPSNVEGDLGPFLCRLFSDSHRAAMSLTNTLIFASCLLAPTLQDADVFVLLAFHWHFRARLSVTCDPCLSLKEKGLPPPELQWC